MWGNHTDDDDDEKGHLSKCPPRKKWQLWIWGGRGTQLGKEGGGRVSTKTIDCPLKIRSWKVHSAKEHDCFVNQWLCKMCSAWRWWLVASSLFKNRLNNRTLSQTMSSNDIISFLIACVRLFWEEGIDLKVVGSLYAKGQKISCDIFQPYCI